MSTCENEGASPGLLGHCSSVRARKPLRGTSGDRHLRLHGKSTWECEVRAGSQIQLGLKLQAQEGGGGSFPELSAGFCCEQRKLVINLNIPGAHG